MADFVSALTGVQMDSALLDMAEHNSEAWAVGERNGIAVPSGDVTYENNARYYAQQAQSIAPASVTEAVRWDIAQTALTDANRQQARNNIDAGKNGAWTNPNLLDNWYFVGGGSQLGDGVFPINQRGLTSYSAYVNSIDRWYAAAAMTVAADGILCDAIVQKIPTDGALRGKTLTFSVLKADGTIISGTAVFQPTGDTYFYNSGGDTLVYNSYFSGFEVVTSSKIAAVKLELGTVSTLANDAPPVFSEELAKCQHYLTIFHFPASTIFVTGTAADTSTLETNLVTPVPMRAVQPNVSSAGGVLSLGNGTIGSVTNVSVGIPYENNLRTRWTGTFSQYYPYSIGSNSSGYTLTISCEL